MTPEQTEILALAQSIYLAKNNRYNDVDASEQTEFMEQTIDWVNQWVEELELEADWNYVRTNRYDMGAVLTATTTFPLPADVNRLVVSEYREVVITQDDTVVATFVLVNPNQISDPTNYDSEDRCTVVGRTLVFSRELTEEEIGGHVKADVVKYIPRLAMDDTEMLDLVKPKQLIILGVAKNATLPDIVQGGISPSLTQKYNDLLQKAVNANNATAGSDLIGSEDFSFVRGLF